VKALLAGPLTGHKVLLFTSFHDTALYLYQQLQADPTWQAQAGQPVLGLISGDTKPDERKRLIERFAPNANRPPEVPGDHAWKPAGEEITVLLSTDVLSEGQNLQDAGVIINYDLHWNPVRLIQRAGRVDRIGSAFPHISLYNVFPEAALENLMGLVQRLSERIAQIDQSVGLDASVLGEVISPRSLEQLRRLHESDQSLLHDLERQAELVSTEEMRFPLLNYIQQIGKGVVEEIPLGIHSGKRFTARDARPGTFIALSAGERQVWRFYPDDGSQPETNVRTIYAMLACAREEPRVEPGLVPYDLLERATQDVLRALRGEQTRVRTRAALTGTAQKLYNWLNRPDLWGAHAALDPEQLRRLNGVLEGVSLRPFEQDRALKTLVKAYETGSDFVQLVSDLDSFFTESSLYQASEVDEITAQAIKIEDLRLVCYERLVPT
jgi:hypothetical protein